MVFRARFAAGLLGWGLAVAGLGALGASGCGGTSVEHVSDGGTSSGQGGGGQGGGGASTGGTASGGTDSSGLANCDTASQFAGPEYVDWNVSPDLSCAGLDVVCYQANAPSLSTCLDGGVPEPGRPAGDAAPPAGPLYGCPNVRALCSTQIGCCEGSSTLVAGPSIGFNDPGSVCCYLAQPGFLPR